MASAGSLLHGSRPSFFHRTVTVTISLGAKVIEKHFTFDKTSEGPDHPHSLDGPEFKQMVEHIRQVEVAIRQATSSQLELQTTFQGRRILPN